MEELLSKHRDVLALSKAELLKKTKKYHNLYFPKRLSWIMAFLIFMKENRELPVLDLKERQKKRALEKQNTVFVRHDSQPYCLLIRKLPRDCIFYIVEFLDNDTLFYLASTCRTFNYFMPQALLGKFKKAITIKMQRPHGPLLYKGSQRAKDFLLQYNTPHGSDVGALLKAKRVADVKILANDIKIHGSTYHGELFRSKNREVEDLESKILADHFKKFLQEAEKLGFAFWVHDIHQTGDSVKMYLTFANTISITRNENKTFHIEIVNPGLTTRLAMLNYDKNHEFYKLLVDLEDFESLLKKKSVCLSPNELVMTKVDFKENLVLDKFKALLEKEKLSVFRKGKVCEKFNKSKLIYLDWIRKYALVIPWPEHSIWEVSILNNYFENIVCKSIPYHDWPAYRCFHGMNLITNDQDLTNMEPLGFYIPLHEKISPDLVFNYLLDELEKYSIKIYLYSRRYDRKGLRISLNNTKCYLLTDLNNQSLINNEPISKHISRFIFTFVVKGKLPSPDFVEAYANEIRKNNINLLSDHLILIYENFNLDLMQIGEINRELVRAGYHFSQNGQHIFFVRFEHQSQDHIKIYFSNDYSAVFKVTEEWIASCVPRFDMGRFSNFYYWRENRELNESIIDRENNLSIRYTPPFKLESAEPLLKKQK